MDIKILALVVNFIYLYVSQLYCNLEESSLINTVKNYNNRLTFNDKFTIMSNCTYFDLIIFISWTIKGLVTRQR